MADDTWLVVGLGNPGPGYAAHRHNVGQMALDRIAAHLGAGFKTHKAGALVAEGRPVPGGPKLVLAKPGSFMNLSGGPVAQLARFYSLDASRLVVLHDELDLPFDTVRLKQGGGHGGHNGLRDIIARMGSNDFARVRIGIGRPPGRQDPADFVLKPFSGAERESLPVLLEDAADATEQLAAQGIVAAQQRWHAPR
ncbi:aminoacyl-tRNA hydrolase [Homoserinibacter sp. YIM 151385]|uniref:aminoacyl-tRNA hydrolase n=1 Tax=Homoserinibacter sp. YIM 151385 TaxID=2985506 RepID=UPI0022F05CAC|nr:aminoacyl-tRNA hydrolase [Homoserinibacter sp. YIM 151385]WBU38017.1 aminoacyl-tRNA hydrolase [Homoserinibacter sp. YIM 151385]